MTRVGAGLASDDGRTRRTTTWSTPQGGWLMPGLWDQHVHLAQWTLSSARLDLAPGPLGRAGRRAGARAARGVARPPRHRLGPPADRVGRGAGHRPPRRHRHRAAHRADRRRRPPRLAQHRRPADARAADPPERGERGGVVHGLRPALDRARHRRHRPGGLPPHHGERRRARRRRRRRLRVQRRGGRLGRALGRRRGPDPGAARLLRRRPRGRHLPRAALGRPARRRPPADDGPAQDHQRRVAQHPHGLVLRPLRREGRPRLPGGPAQPDARGAAHAAAPGRRARPRRRGARHRGPGGHRGAGRLRRHRGPRRHRARPAHDPRRRTPHGRASASAPACSPPTSSTTAT